MQVKVPKLSASSFSIHVPARGATSNTVKPVRIAKVSIHAPARGATIFSHFYSLPSMFQSTHPRGVRQPINMPSASVLQFQSTHPRGVRPLKRTSSATSFDVSIHAPARGATGDCSGTRISCLFQSTHPRGVRRASITEGAKRKVVSIHAPARGATDAFSPSFYTGRVSIHAPARGATTGIHR